jgi:hypothetical protein
LGIELSEITLVDGQQLPVQTQLSQASGGAISAGSQVAAVGITSGMGAAIGAAADGGRGAGIGAVAGAAAGMIGVMLTPGRPTVIPPESLLSFRLTAPVTISTAHSQAAFQLVSQRDYSDNMSYDRYQQGGAAPAQAQYPPSNPAPVVAPPPAPYPYYAAPAPYYYGAPYYYPAPYYGYGYYGYGPSFVFSFGSGGHYYGGRSYGYYGRGAVVGHGSVGGHSHR